MNPLRLYRQGILVSVLRNADGAWQGTLRDVVGLYGYWVYTLVTGTIDVPCRRLRFRIDLPPCLVPIAMLVRPNARTDPLGRMVSGAGGQ